MYSLEIIPYVLTLSKSCFVDTGIPSIKFNKNQNSLKKCVTSGPLVTATPIRGPKRFLTVIAPKSKEFINFFSR